MEKKLCRRYRYFMVARTNCPATLSHAPLPVRVIFFFNQKFGFEQRKKIKDFCTIYVAVPFGIKWAIISFRFWFFFSSFHFIMTLCVVSFGWGGRRVHWFIFFHNFNKLQAKRKRREIYERQNVPKCATYLCVCESRLP